jgi:lycopene cyclase domain-containing protein
MTYSALGLISVATVILIDLAIARTFLLATFRFWFSYAIVFGFQLLTNSWLTGWNTVMYDPEAIWGIRWANAPIEDLLFGFSLILGTLIVWRVLDSAGSNNRQAKQQNASRADGT